MQMQFDTPFGDTLLFAQRARLCEIVEQIRLAGGLASAIRQNDTAAVQFWLSEGADPNAFANPRHRTSALLLAIIDIIEVDDVDDDFQETYYFVPAPGNRAIMAALLDAGADIHTRYPGGETALMFAVRFSSAEVVAFLLSRGADLTTRHYYDQCALHYAATYRDVDVVRALLDAGADINARDRAGKTPLMAAVEYMLLPGSSTMGKTESIEALLARDADTNIRDVAGKRVLDYFPGGLTCRFLYGPQITRLRKLVQQASRKQR